MKSGLVEGQDLDVMTHSKLVELINALPLCRVYDLNNYELLELNNFKRLALRLRLENNKKHQLKNSDALLVIIHPFAFLNRDRYFMKPIFQSTFEEASKAQENIVRLIEKEKSYDGEELSTVVLETAPDYLTSTFPYHRKGSVDRAYITQLFSPKLVDENDERELCEILRNKTLLLAGAYAQGCIDAFLKRMRGLCKPKIVEDAVLPLVHVKSPASPTAYYNDENAIIRFNIQDTLSSEMLLSY